MWKNLICCSGTLISSSQTFIGIVCPIGAVPRGRADGYVWSWVMLAVCVLGGDGLSGWGWEVGVPGYIPFLPPPCTVVFLKPGWLLVHSSLLSVVSTRLLLCASTRDVMTW